MACETVLNFGYKYASDLKVVHINAQSLHNSLHFDEFKNIFGDGVIDIIGVSETFYKDTSSTEICNYNVMAVNRKNRNGGGVAIYVRKSLKSKILSTSKGETGVPEYIICEIVIDNVKVLFASVYRPPHVGYMDIFQDDLCSLLTQYKYTIICGDLNARFGTDEYETKIITNILNQCNLTPVPFNATYHTAHSSSNLDVIASNCNDLIIEYGQTEASGFSEHDLIYAAFNLKVPRIQKKTITYRDFKRLDQGNIFEYGNLLPWENIYKLKDINEKVELFNDLMMNVYETCVPLKTVRIKKHTNPWMADELKQLLKERDRLRKVFAKSKNPDDYEVFRKHRNKVKQKVRNAKVRYFNELFERCDNGKDTWSVIHSLGLGKKKTDSDITVPPNELIQYFTDVSTVRYAEEVNNMLPMYERENTTHCDEILYFKYVTPEDIVNAVCSFKSNATGVDLLSIKFVKICLPLILPVLEHIFNFSMQNGKFPKFWKMSNIRPVAKIKNPSSCKDYRPVSILCLLAKVLEKLVHVQVNEFINAKNILPPFQSGFRQGHNTTTALIKVTDDVRRAIDKRMLTILLLLDMSKAFDCVHHTLLLKKLKFINFSDSVIQWFQSYLSERKMRVYAGEECYSEWKKVETGVPQGSVLGPLLFAIYLFDLPNILKHCNYHMYADDIQLYLHFPLESFVEILDQLKTDLLLLIEYLKSHNLLLNVEKTQAMVLGSAAYVSQFNHKNFPNLEVNGSVIPYMQCVKNLGIYLDSTLSWNEHCNFVINKVFCIVAQLRRNFSYIPFHIRRVLVQSLIFPYFDYLLPLCTNITQTNLVKLQRAQNACVRFVCNVNKSQHITPYYELLNILKLKDRQRMILAKMVYKIILYKTPVYLSQQFKYQPSSINRTRSSNMLLQYSSPRTESWKLSFFIQACTQWNSLKLYHNKSIYSLTDYIRARL
jgi:hypothetical protein